MLFLLPVLVHGLSNLKLEDVLLDSWMLSNMMLWNMPSEHCCNTDGNIISFIQRLHLEHLICTIDMKFYQLKPPIYMRI